MKEMNVNRRKLWAGWGLELLFININVAFYIAVPHMFLATSKYSYEIVS